MIMILHKASGPISGVLQNMVGLAVLALVSVPSVSTDASLQAAESDVRSATAFGAKGNGTTDDTAAIQKALDEAAKAVGGDWKPVHEFMWKNLEAFIFGRTDWEYVNNTFVYPVNIGYRFIATKNGAANGQFAGIGADEAQICVKVDAIQPMGLLISNGQFVSMHGDIRTEVLVEKTCHGSVRLVNCAFWGPARQCVVSHSQSFVSLSDCFLSSTGRKNNPGNFLVEADGGRLQVRGCSFGSDEPGIALRSGLQHAIITENNGVTGVEIANEIGARAVLASNELPPHPTK